jgi:transposase
MREVGHIIAAKILGHVGDITRFPSADDFASYADTSPLDASSGEQRPNPRRPCYIRLAGVLLNRNNRVCKRRGSVT